MTSTAAESDPPTPVRTKRAAATSARSASTNAKPMCSTCWSRLPNTGKPGSWYIALCHSLAATRASRWSRPKASTLSRSPDVELDVHHRRAGDALVRGVDARDLVPEVGERGPDLGDRRTSPRGTERDPDERGDGEAQEQPAEHIGRKAGAEVHRGEADQDDDDGEHATEGTHDVRREPERRAR